MLDIAVCDWNTADKTKHTNTIRKKKTSSVYDCTVEDAE